MNMKIPKNIWYPALLTFFSIVLLCGCSKNLVRDDLLTSAGLLANDWGVEVLPIRLSANDHMVDFRFKVIDPQKALPLLNREVKPYLIDQATGRTLSVPVMPKVGALRQTTEFPIAGRNYFIFFTNAGKSLKRGDRVAVVIGTFKAADLVLQ